MNIKRNMAIHQTIKFVGHREKEHLMRQLKGAVNTDGATISIDLWRQNI